MYQCSYITYQCSWNPTCPIIIEIIILYIIITIKYYEIIIISIQDLNYDVYNAQFTGIMSNRKIWAEFI